MSKLKKTTIIIFLLLTTCVAFEYAREGFQPSFSSLYHMTIEYFEPDFSSLLYLGDLVTYRINPNTILASIENGDEDIFELIPKQVNDDYESIYPPGTFAWKQEDHMQIADSLHQEVWKESLDGWQLIN